jgi:hypothetical protein
MNESLVDQIQELANLCQYLPETQDYLTDVYNPERALETLVAETLPPTDEELIQRLREELNNLGYDEEVTEQMLKDLPKDLQKLNEIEMYPPNKEEVEGEIREEWLEQMSKIMNPILHSLANFALYQ